MWLFGQATIRQENLSGLGNRRSSRISTRELLVPNVYFLIVESEKSCTGGAMDKLLASLEGQDNHTSYPSKDRRQRERLQLFLPVHLKPIDSNDPLEEEVTNTMNFSRTGLCFTTLLTHYCEGMLVTV